MVEAINWFKVGHFTFFIAWMAGLLMLPRLLVYWLEGEPNGEVRRVMDEATGRLLKIVMLPALIGTWLFGLALLGHQWAAISGQPWLWGKLLGALALSGYHGWMIGVRRKTLAGAAPLKPKTLRMLNEVPFLVAIVMIILVLIEPFRVF